jgi:hypothetical protein
VLRLPVAAEAMPAREVPEDSARAPAEVATVEVAGAAEEEREAPTAVMAAREVTVCKRVGRAAPGPLTEGEALPATRTGLAAMEAL